MKKYVKPELFYEHFELSQHIADCGWEMQYANKESCHAAADPGVWGEGYVETLFVSEDRCTVTDWQDYCYEAGTGGIKVFIS